MEWKLRRGKEPVEAPTKESAITAMAGFSGGLDAAADSAPTSTSDAVATPASVSNAPKRGRNPKAGAVVSTPIPDAAAIAEAQRIAKRQAALQKISEHMMQDMAGAPYDMWAALMSDEDMKLSEEEKEELGSAYRLVAESLPMGELPGWITLSLFILGRNAKLVQSRMKLMQENQEKAMIAEQEKQKRGQ